ncbi:MAG: LON peptidase substrate-binding domain-containing protein [Terriglobia bacterium]|jgi:Lon protease-like protein
MEENLLPLFPLEIVLLPEEPLPLHIFEDRYKTMIGECLRAKAAGKGQQEFGVVLLKGQAMSAAGCTARILNLTRQYDDGRLDILTVGKRRFEVMLTNEERPYLQGAVAYFEDEGPDAPSDEAAELAIERFREVMRRLRHAAEMPVHLPRPYRYLSFRIAAALPLDLEFKQQLLTLRNEPERLTLVQRALEILMGQLDQVQESQEKAGGNGHFRRG